MISWIVLIALVAASIVYSWWFLLGVVVVGLWKYALWHRYSSRPWRKVHFPMMVAFASASGLESGLSQREGREYDLHSALMSLLEIVNPKVSIGHEMIVAREFVRCARFDDEKCIRAYLESSSGLDARQMDGVLQVIKEAMDPTSKAIMARMVIAAVVEEQFSVMDRGEYLFAVFSGRAP